jgi:hypothetical protein
MGGHDDPSELGQVTGSEGEQGWIGTPEETLEALLNLPAPLKPMVSIQGGGESPESVKQPDHG